MRRLASSIEKEKERGGKCYEGTSQLSQLICNAMHNAGAMAEGTVGVNR